MSTRRRNIMDVLYLHGLARIGGPGNLFAFGLLVLASAWLFRISWREAWGWFGSLVICELIFRFGGGVLSAVARVLGAAERRIGPCLRGKRSLPSVEGELWHLANRLGMAGRSPPA